MSFFYDLIGAHTPKERLIVDSSFLAISLTCLILDSLRFESLFWIAYWGFCCILSAWNIIDSYFEIRKEKAGVKFD